MRHTYAKYLLFSTILLSAVSGTAQPYNYSNKENSPYSRFGIGELRNGVNTSLKGMGSISSAYSNGLNVNTDNPASYASLQLTTYEGAGEGTSATLNSGVDKYKVGMATVSYMDIGIPLGKHAGMALGMKPFSRVFYQMNDTSAIDTFGTGVKSYLGSGALTEGFVGFAGKVKGVSLGFNFGYVFGGIERTSSLEPLDITTNVISSRFYTNTRMGGLYWNAGAMYEHKLSKTLGFRIGGTFTASQELNANRSEYWIGYKYEADTAYKLEGQKGKITLPTKYSIGLMLISTHNWNAGVDYSAASWSQYRTYGLTDSLASSAYKMSGGVEYTPDPEGKKLVSRVTYRLGGYYGTDPVMLRNTQLNYYALTAGMSIPFRKNIARIHTSLEVGSRGTTANGLIRENFVKFGLGFSFNDKWFIKRKYD